MAMKVKDLPPAASLTFEGACATSLPAYLLRRIRPAVLIAVVDYGECARSLGCDLQIFAEVVIDVGDESVGNVVHSHLDTSVGHKT
jgi:hypothetical protein